MNRTAWLTERGFKVLRFWNHDVFQQTASVMEVIMTALL
jgi:very-short-patch-repair endonuclease